MTPGWSLKSRMMGRVSSGPFPGGAGGGAVKAGQPWRSQSSEGEGDTAGWGGEAAI